MSRTPQRFSTVGIGFLFVCLCLWISMRGGSVQALEPAPREGAQVGTPALTAAAGSVEESRALLPGANARWPSQLQTKGNRLVNGAGENARRDGQ
jgi:hypothetical protein